MSEIAQRFPMMSTVNALNANLLRWQRDWKLISLRLDPQILAIDARVREVTRSFAPILNSFRDATRILGPLFEGLYRNEAPSRLSEAVGWLPHRTTPFELLSANDLSEQKAAAILEAHYVDRWEQVRAVFLEAIREYAIDDVAKAAMSEALDNHEAGRFRSVVALVFNEIERVVRVELYGGRLGGIASLPELQELANEMGTMLIQPGGGAGLRLFDRLVGHLYSNVKTEEDVERLANDPVPNRHAAAHGLIVYDSRQNSMNTLIMADYVFQVISLAKAESNET
jgi:hypothetical protein